MTSRTKNIIAGILQFESKLVLRRYKPKVIAITGSVGKTSTKDAVYASLAEFTHVRKAAKSYNTEIGIPLTILGVPNGWNNMFTWMMNFLRGLWLIIWPQQYPKWLVLEVATGKPGDIPRIVSWLRADVVILTKISDVPVHIEFFESQEQYAQEKKTLIQALKPDGTLILNYDDPLLRTLKQSHHVRTLSYGFGEGADVRASNEHIHYSDRGIPVGVQFKLDYDGHSVPVAIDGLFGKNHLYAALAACAVAKTLSYDVLRAAEALRSYDNPPGRMNMVLGVKNSLIIDDTYNSSPDACQAALEILEKLTVPGRKIAVLGDMLELGKHTAEEHENIGRSLADSVDLLVTVGKRAVSFGNGAREAGMPDEKILGFSDSRSAGKFVEQEIKEGDIILVKGSQGVRMERTVEEIMAHPELKEKLLVRQEAQWLAKK